MKILATSRESLAVAGEARYRLAPLALPDPEDLTEAARAEAVAAAVDYRAVAAGEVCRHRAAWPRPGVVLADGGRDGRGGLGYPAGPPRLARLAHRRAVLVARLWFTATPAWARGQAWWQSERRIRRKGPAAGAHRPDAEIWWPSLPASRYAGQIWAIEVELTAKHADRTAAIMAGLAAPAGYARVVYLTAPAARGVVARCAGALPPGRPVEVTVWDLPATAYPPGA